MATITTALPTAGEGKTTVHHTSALTVSHFADHQLSEDTMWQVLILIAIAVAVVITMAIALIIIVYSIASRHRAPAPVLHSATNGRATGLRNTITYNEALIDTIRATKSENIYI